MASDAPRRNTKRVLLVLTLTLVIIVAGTVSYYYLYAPTRDCVYSPGNGVYFHLISSTSGTSLINFPVKGQLIKSCLSSWENMQNYNIQIIGSWNFQTNGTGFVSVPSSDLSGGAFWFTVTFGGGTYLAKSPICSEGVTYVQLSLPAGAVSGREIPGNINGTTFISGANGIETIIGCDGIIFHGNATIS